jgi:tight adherence protein B
LAAGNTFEEALVQAARESPDPIRPLFASVGRQVRLGAPLEVVLAEAGDIYRIRDVRVIALATSINRKYGGSMRSVLKSLITAIRQRGNAAKELRALTAETRFSAYTLAFITISLFLFLFLSNRTYYNSMLESTGGTVMLGVSGGMVFFGFFVLWRMIKSIDEDDS